jgi:hypothetical protein
MLANFVQLITYRLPSILDGCANLCLATEAVTERTFLAIHIYKGPPLPGHCPVRLHRQRNSEPSSCGIVPIQELYGGSYGEEFTKRLIAGRAC